MSTNRQILLLGLLLWAQCLFVGSTFRTLPIMSGFAAMITLVIVLLRYFRPSRPTYPQKAKRWWIAPVGTLAFLTNLAVVLPWRATGQLSEETNYVYLVIDSLAHTSMTFALLLWSRRPATGHPSMIPLGCVVVLMSCAAGGASSSLTAQTALALTICIGFVLGCELILKHQLGFGELSSQNSPSSQVSKWLVPIFSLLVLSVLLMGTSGVANGTNMILPTIQSKLQEELKTSFNAMAEESYVGGTRYVRGSELGSLRKHMLGDPAEIAVQAYCQIAPGYLRGSVFDQYFRGRWIDSGSFEYQRYTRTARIPDQMIPPSSMGTTELNVTTRQPLNHFDLLPNPPNKIIPVEVLSDPSKGSIIFTPLNSFWIEASSQEIAYTPHGVVRSGVDVRRPYVIGVGQRLPPTQLIPEIQEFTLQIPSRLEMSLREYGSNIVGEANTPAKIANAVSEHFQSQYGYSLNTKIDRPRNEDPIAYFLDTQHDAHCEFFASATVMLLRSLGVRSRYVTGYIVDEISEDETGLWLGRNRDAHAWAEAYDEMTQTWFPVESTPGRTYRTIEPEQDALIAGDASGNLLENQTGLDESLFENLFNWLAAIRFSEPIVILFRVAQLPVFLGLVFFIWKRHRKATSSLDAKEELRCRRMLRRADRLLRRMNLNRAPSETLWQFSDRIHHAAGQVNVTNRQQRMLKQYADWYRAFASARYQGLSPSPVQRQS